MIYLPPAAFGFDLISPVPLAMSASIPSETQKLSKEELALHHYAAMVKASFKIHRASATENEHSLKVALKKLLVCF